VVCANNRPQRPCVQMIGQPAGAVTPSNAIDFLTLVTNLKVSRFEPLSQRAHIRHMLH